MPLSLQWCSMRLCVSNLDISLQALSFLKLIHDTQVHVILSYKGVHETCTLCGIEEYHLRTCPIENMYVLRWLWISLRVALLTLQRMLQSFKMDKDEVDQKIQLTNLVSTHVILVLRGKRGLTSILFKALPPFPLSKQKTKQNTNCKLSPKD